MEEKLKGMQKKSNDLSDIILEKSVKKTEKTKKIMLLVASLVLFFLIVLIIVKILNKDSTSTSDNNIAQSTQITPIESTTQPTQESEDALFSSAESENRENEQLFKQEPIIEQDSDTDLKFEEMVRKLKEQDEQQTTSEPIEQTAINEQPESTREPESTIVNKSVVTQTEPISTPKVSSSTLAIAKTIPSSERIIVSSKEFSEPIEYKAPPKKEWKPLQSKKPISYPQSKQKHKQKHQTANNNAFNTLSGYFVQVGATSRAFPDQNFLNKVRNSGYDYIIHNITVKGKVIKKILVGPYKSRSSASNALGDIKAKINPSAYIYRIK